MIIVVTVIVRKYVHYEIGDTIQLVSGRVFTTSRFTLLP